MESLLGASNFESVDEMLQLAIQWNLFAVNFMSRYNLFFSIFDILLGFWLFALLRLKETIVEIYGADNAS